MTTKEIITTLETSTSLVDINSGLSSLFDTLLSNGNITDSADLEKIARCRARINIELLH